MLCSFSLMLSWHIGTTWLDCMNSSVSSQLVYHYKNDVYNPFLSESIQVKVLEHSVCLGSTQLVHNMYHKLKHQKDMYISPFPQTHLKIN